MQCGRGTAARCAIRRAKLTPRMHQALHAEALYAKGSIGDRICQPIPTHPIMQREAYSIASRERARPATRSSLRRCGARPAHVCPSSPSNEFMRGVAICTLILHALQVGHANKLGRKPIAPEIVHRQQRDLRASCHRPTLWLRAGTVFMRSDDVVLRAAVAAEGDAEPLLRPKSESIGQWCAVAAAVLAVRCNPVVASSGSSTSCTASTPAF